MAEGWNEMIIKVPSNQNHLMILCFHLFQVTPFSIYVIINAFSCHCPVVRHKLLQGQKGIPCFTTMSIPGVYHSMRQPQVTFALAVPASSHFLVCFINQRNPPTVCVTYSARTSDKLLVNNYVNELQFHCFWLWIPLLYPLDI